MYFLSNKKEYFQIKYFSIFIFALRFIFELKGNIWLGLEMWTASSEKWPWESHCGYLWALKWATSIIHINDNEDIYLI